MGIKPEELENSREEKEIRVSMIVYTISIILHRQFINELGLNISKLFLTTMMSLSYGISEKEAKEIIGNHLSDAILILGRSGWVIEAYINSDPLKEIYYFSTKQT